MSIGRTLTALLVRIVETLDSTERSKALLHRLHPRRARGAPAPGANKNARSARPSTLGGRGRWARRLGAPGGGPVALRAESEQGELERLAAGGNAEGRSTVPLDGAGRPTDVWPWSTRIASGSARSARMPVPASSATTPAGMCGAMTARTVGQSSLARRATQRTSSSESSTRALGFSGRSRRTTSGSVCARPASRARAAPRAAAPWRRPVLALALGLAHDEHVVGRQRARHRDAHRALERARIAGRARGDGVRERLGRRDHRARRRLVGLGIERAHRDARARRRVELTGEEPRIGLEDARAGGDEVDQRARLREHLERLARRRRDQEIELGGTRLLFSSAAAASRSRSEAPESPPRMTWVTGFPRARAPGARCRLRPGPADRPPTGRR